MASPRHLPLRIAGLVLGALLVSGCPDPQPAGDGSDDRAVMLDGRAAGELLPVADGPGRLDGSGELDGPAACTDPCPAPKGGVSWQCHKRFMYGTNWAWLHFAADFGGIAAWGQLGVSAASGDYQAAMKQMKADGVRVIRWWMFPRFRTEAILFDSDDAPAGIGGTLVADLQRALELAEDNDLSIMLTLFSFDNFTPTETEAGVYSRGIQPLVVDAARRKKLIQNLVRPVVYAVESSPHWQRMVAWDIINEPEWAISGPNLYGGAAFTPMSELQTVTHAQMETFLKEVATELQQSSSALVTVGSAGIKWANAWSEVPLDFYQLHYYGWVYEWYPYQTVTLASVGLTDRPVVMGEFPQQGLAAVPAKGLPAVSAGQLATDLWNGGYAGALSWAFNDPSFPWSTALLPFANQHPCQTQY